MKPTPTPIDRDAAELFTPAPGMRACNADGEWGRLAEAVWAGVVLLHRRFDSMALHGARIDAIDTDDPATVGVMLAQVRAAANDPALHVVAGEPDLDGLLWWSVPRRFAGRSALSRTEGAALVAAMRSLRGTSS